MLSRIFLLSVVALCSSAFATIGIAQETATAKQISADKLFASDQVAEIQIKLGKEQWDEIRTQSRSFVDALGTEPAESPFTYVSADVTIDGVLIKNVGLRKKGFLGSLNDSRPSLKIKFSEYTSQDPIQGLDRLTLNNNNQDPARICQYLSYKMFNDSGTIAPRCGFAKVTVNGKYLGLYSNVESVKPQFLERRFGDGTGDLFEGTIADFFPQWVQKFERKKKSASLDQLKSIAEILAQDTVDLKQLESQIDLDAFLDFWAMESLIGFWDGYCSNQNNFFVYNNPANSKIYFVPWGTDSSFTQTTPLPPYRIRPKSVHAKAILPNKLYRIPEIQKRYDERLMSFLEKHWDEETVVGEINRLDAMLKDHVLESNDKYVETMKKFRKFVETRRANIMREYKKGSPKLRSREQIPVHFAAIGTATAKFSTKWFDASPKGIADLQDIKLDLVIDGEKVEMTNVHSFAELSKWPSPDGRPPSLVFIGNRKSDNMKLTLGLSTTLEKFKPTNGKTIDFTGIYIEGMNFMPEGGMKMIGGKAILEKASMENGDPVVGEMQMTIKQMRMGQSVEEKK